MGIGMEQQIDIWILYFFIYSVLGWVCETIYCSVGSRKLVARGFLYGPYCPIYGFGALILLGALQPLHDYPVLIFFVGMLACSVLEYFTSWLMEKLFHMRWWDYSKRKFNLNGRVCLLNSTLFGIGGMILVYVVHPVISKWVKEQGADEIVTLATLVVAVILIDLVASLASTLKFTSVIKDAQESIDKFKEEHPNDPHPTKGALSVFLHENVEKVGETGGATAHKILEKMGELNPRNLRNRWVTDETSTVRLMGTGSDNNDENALDVWREYSKQQAETHKENRAKKKTEKQEAREKAKEDNVFAPGLSFNKIFWIFMIASVLGYVVEVIWSYATKGYAASTQGLLYGPISQVYGIGAVLLTLTLYKFTSPEEKNKSNNLEIFIIGALVGGGFEVICSWVEEKLFGFISWYYTPESFGILGGRTSIMFMAFWGFLSVVFIKKVYPVMSDLIEKTPRKAGQIITVITFILLMIDVILTVGAVYRYSRRTDDIPATSSVGQWLDETYPDSRMEKIFPGMETEADKIAKAASKKKSSES